MKFIKYLIPLLFLTPCTVNKPSEGSKIGRIVKLSKDGLFSKTWEGELIRGGLTDGSGVNGTSFHFTIESTDMAYRALDLMEQQKEVILYYEVELFSSMFRSERNEPHFIKQIQEVK